MQLAAPLKGHYHALRVDGAKQEAMHCFSAESAGLVGYLMIHEIVGRNELWADPRFQARHHRHSHMLPRL